LGQLRYQASIRAYLTEFRALNNFARATGEVLQENVDLAMPDAVLDMRSAHYLEDFADNEGFLQATHQAGLQVEKKKALRLVREQVKGPTGTGGKREEGKKDGQKRDSDNTRKGKEPGEQRKQEARKNSWPTQEAALKGVPAKEAEAYRQNRENCWRCG